MCYCDFHFNDNLNSSPIVEYGIWTQDHLEYENQGNLG